MSAQFDLQEFLKACFKCFAAMKEIVSRCLYCRNTSVEQPIITAVHDDEELKKAVRLLDVYTNGFISCFNGIFEPF